MPECENIRLFPGTAHPEFACNVAKSLGIPLTEVKHFRFSDGEIGFSIEESIRGADAYIIQPTCYPASENLMELLIMADALRRASAGRINAIVPYFGFARQDRKAKPREPITAKLVANLITKSGVDRVVSADLHTGQIQGFFDIPVDHLTGIPLLADYFKELLQEDLDNDRVVVVSPDVGGVARARRFAMFLKKDTDIAIVDKRRNHEVANVSEVMDIIGHVRDRVAILVDDMVDTAGTICHAAEGLISKGATRVFACATHPVLSGNAIINIQKAPIEQFVFTDTIPIEGKKKLVDNIHQISMAPAFAEAIERIHNGLSVSDYLDRIEGKA